MDIAERRLPQDGRIELRIGGAPVDLRVSVLPTMHGESVVMRVLDRSNVKLELEARRPPPRRPGHLPQAHQQANGIVIVTGPTGSGKTTTLYAALQELNDVGSKILTGRGPGGVRHRRAVPVPDQHRGGADVRALPAQLPASGPGHHPRRRDPRPGDGRDRRPGLPHRPPGAHDAPHQRRPQLHPAPRGPRDRALPPHGDPRGHRGPAPRAHHLPQVQGGVHPEGRGAHGAQPSSRGYPRAPSLPGARLRALPQLRLQGPAWPCSRSWP